MFDDQSTVEEVSKYLTGKMPDLRITVGKEVSAGPTGKRSTLTCWTLHLVFDEEHRHCFICSPIDDQVTSAISWHAKNKPIYS